jgi:glycosyltransferase involved in cell wall biosynthesis
MAPDICVVVPCLNGEAWLDQTLGSIAGQTVRDIEVVVVDDGSTDASVAIARDWLARDARFRLVLGPPRGIARSRSLGASIASPSVRWLCFMDHDDLWQPDAVESLRQAVRPGQVGAHALAERIGPDGQVLPGASFAAWQRDREGVVGGRYVARSPSQPTRFADVLHLFKIYPAGVALWSRTDYGAIGGHDPRYHLVDDWDLALRMMRRGPLAFVDRVLVMYRRHAGSTSDSDGRQRVVVPETRRVWASTYYDRSLTPEQRSAVRSGWRLLMRTRAGEKRNRAASLCSQGRRVDAVREALDAQAQALLRMPPRWWASAIWSSGHAEPVLRQDRERSTVETGG